MNSSLLDLVRELNTLNDDNLADRVIANNDVQWCLSELQDILEDMPTLTPPPITGDTSDGYHTFNELYHHRAILFSVICNERPDIAWKSKRHHDGTMYDGMFIVGIDTPEGQATYHYDIEPYWGLFHVRELEFAPKWDGHTPDEAIRRIGTLTPPNEPLTQADLDGMDYDKVWIDYEDGTGEWALVCNGYIYSIDTLEGAGFDFVDYMRGERLEPHGYKVYRRPPEGEV